MDDLAEFKIADLEEAALDLVETKFKATSWTAPGIVLPYLNMLCRPPAHAAVTRDDPQLGDPLVGVARPGRSRVGFARSADP